MNFRLPPPFVEPREADRKAETAAMACLDECRQSLKLPNVSIPVPVETWIEHPLGIDYGFEVMSGMYGYAVLGNNLIRISQELADDEHSVRWTAAHELGHLRMHSPDEDAIKVGDPRYWQLYKNPAERQAERFAAAFLMPPVELVRSFFTICNQQQLDPEDVIPSLLRRTARTQELWETTFIPGLVRIFNVSRCGVLFRLGELRLSDGAPLLLPAHLFSLSQMR